MTSFNSPQSYFEHENSHPLLLTYHYRYPDIMSFISVEASQIFDSRGNPTVQVVIETTSGELQRVVRESDNV